MAHKLTGLLLVDIVKALSLRKIKRTGPKATRKKRVRKFLKEFDNN